jgi:two-component system response regulator LytT
MHVLIVEDEPAISERIQRQVSQILGNRLGKLKSFDNLDDAQEYIAEQSIDLLFLDLNLQGEDGFELLGSLTASSFHTVIISAYADKAIQAFEYSILDFIAKPFTKQRLEQAINRILDVKFRQDYGVRYLSIKLAKEIKLIEISDIDYIIAADHYSELVINEKKMLHDKSIQKLLLLLPPSFEQIHRSYIVNMNKVLNVIAEGGSKYTLTLKNGEQLPISRSRFSVIKSKLAY